jgi:5-methylcytosine-specific restriction endonuclease McrA
MSDNWAEYWKTQQQYRNQKDRIRRVVFSMQENKCASCGSIDNLTLDHIKPMRKGGTNEIGNFQILCFDCNRRKKAK